MCGLLVLVATCVTSCILVYTSEFLVAFDAEPQTRSQAIALEVEVIGPGGATSGPRRVALEDIGGFPTSELPIRPLEGDWHRSFLFTARALRTGGDGELEVFNERSFRATFAEPGPSGRQRHSLRFSDDCILFHRRCAEGETCIEGQCEPIPFIDPTPRPPGTPLREVAVDTPAALAEAVRDASFGDHIVIAPGVYELTANLVSQASGSAGAEIVVRARERGTVELRYVGTGNAEVFLLRHAYWVVEGLDVIGACPSDSACEHAVHVTGGGAHVVLRDNRFVDFNQAIHVNADSSGNTPDDGRFEHNVVLLTRLRAVSTAVTGLRLAQSSRWMVRHNVFRDVVNTGRTAYGAYFVGEAEGGVFEANLVECTRDVAGGGTRVGFSMGAAEPGPHHTRFAFRNNVVRGCGVAIRGCVDCTLAHATIEGDVSVAASSTVRSEGNLVTMQITESSDSTLLRGDDLTERPLEELVVDPDTDLRPRAGAGAITSDVVLDFCGEARPALHSRGALEPSSRCDGHWPPDTRELP